MSKKLPAMMFYTGDWLKDPQLSLCAPATRGVWFDLLCAMHESDQQGVITGTREQLARLSRCSAVELGHALADLQTTGAANVTERDGRVTVINRRMQSLAVERLKAAERQRKSRMSRQRHEKVKDDHVYESEDANEIEIGFFEEFWRAFPNGRKKSKGAARKAFFQALKKVSPQELVTAADEYARSAEGRGSYVKMPSTWLNQECWTDDREAWIREQSDGKKQPERRSRRATV